MDGEMTDDQMRSADDAMHEQMAELYRQQVLEATGNRDAYPDKEAFKNRTLVHAKLDRESYAALFGYAKAKDLSINGALKEILQNHFNIQPND
jgi:hypothetical protein